MLSENGVTVYRAGEVGNERRKKNWGFHCLWPPEWVKLPDDIQKLTMGMLSEREEIYQREFQKKVASALKSLYGINVEELTLEELMALSRSYWFWIYSDGNVGIPPPLW